MPLTGRIQIEVIVIRATGTENVTPSPAAASIASFSQVRTVRSVTVQSLTFSAWPVSGLRRLSGIFSVAEHHLQLGHVLRIGQRNQPVRDHT